MKWSQINLKLRFWRIRKSHKGINTCQISLVRSNSEIWYVSLTKEFIRVKSHLWDLKLRFDTYKSQRNLYNSNLSEISQVRFDMYWFLCQLHEFGKITLRSSWRFISYVFLYRIHNQGVNTTTCAGVPTILFYDNQL